MDDLTPLAIPPLGSWEKTSADQERKQRRHRRQPKESADEDDLDLEEDQSHSLDELA